MRGCFTLLAAGAALVASGCGGGAVPGGEGDAAQDVAQDAFAAQDAPSVEGDAGSDNEIASSAPDATATRDASALPDGTPTTDASADVAQVLAVSDAMPNADSAAFNVEVDSAASSVEVDSAASSVEVDSAASSQADSAPSADESDASADASPSATEGDDADASPSNLDASVASPEAGSVAPQPVTASTYLLVDGGFAGPPAGTEMAALCAGGCTNGTVDCQGQCAPGWILCNTVFNPSTLGLPTEPPTTGPVCTSLETDPWNCGACGAVCAPDRFCVDSVCVPPSSLFLVTGLAMPDLIVVDSTQVYWSDDSADEIVSMPKAGGPMTVLAQGQNAPIGLTVTNGFVYWGTEPTEDGGNAGLLMRAPVDGSTAPQIVTSSLAITTGFGRTPDGATFVVSGETIYFIDGLGNLWMVPASGGASTLLVPIYNGTATGSEVQSFLSLATDGTTLFATGRFGESSDGADGWTLPIATPDEMANPQVSPFVEFGDGADDMLVSGGLLFVATQAGFVTYDAENVLAGQQGGGGLVDGMLPLGCGLLTLHSSLLGPFISPRQTENDYFFTIGFDLIEPGAANIPVGELPAVVLQNNGNGLEQITASVSPVNIATDGTFVYWTDQSGAIGRAPIP
jgi:hypothetical protein